MKQLVVVISLIFTMSAFAFDKSKLPPRSMKDIFAGEEKVQDYYGPVPLQVFYDKSADINIAALLTSIPGLVDNSYLIRNTWSPWAVVGEMTTAILLVDYDLVNEFLSKKGLKAVKVQGQAVVKLLFLDYADSGAGPYQEFAISYAGVDEDDEIVFATFGDYVSSAQKNEKEISFIDHLSLGGPDENFIHFHHAIWAGRVAINYPKFFGTISKTQNDAQAYKIAVDQPEVAYAAATIGDESQAAIAFDQKKAGSLKIEIAVSGLSQPVNDLKMEPIQSVEFHASQTQAENLLCGVKNYIAGEAVELATASESMEVSVLEGNSQSLDLLKKAKGQGGLKVASVVYSPLFYDFIHSLSPRSDANLPGKETSENGCSQFGRRFYDYKLFYPQRILDIAEQQESALDEATATKYK